MIFDEATLQKLNALTLVASNVRAGLMRGDRRSTRRGESIEFADYRNYTPGDDLRRLDWNIYARHDRPFIKLFEEEEDLTAHILIDASRSMDWGTAEQNKFRYAIKLAAALGAITLSGGDRLSQTVLSEQPLNEQYGPARGQAHLLRYFAHLEKLTPTRQIQLTPALTQYAITRPRAGMLFIISDLLDPNGFEAGLGHLLSQKHEIILIQPLTPEELSPSVNGDIKLVDREFGYTQELTVDAQLRKTYAARVLEWQQSIREYCSGRGIHYLPINTETPWEKFVLTHLRREGMLK